MQGTSVPSERIFCTAGDLASAHRACLDPDNVEMIIFVKTNIKLYEQWKAYVNKQTIKWIIVKVSFYFDIATMLNKNFVMYFLLINV
jgi:hypothetical protein